jgi:hypothetical protein
MMVSYEPKIPCEIRCMDPATVEAASRVPDPAGVEWVAYTCKFSGTKQSVLVIGNELAAGIMKLLPAVESLTGMKILASLYSAELCECDVATVAGVAEREVVTQLQKLAAPGMIGHRKIQGMNYYRLMSDIDPAETVSHHCIHVTEPGYQSLHHAQSETGGLLHQ